MTGATGQAHTKEAARLTLALTLHEARLLLAAVALSKLSMNLLQPGSGDQLIKLMTTTILDAGQELS